VLKLKQIMLCFN